MKYSEGYQWTQQELLLCHGCADIEQSQADNTEHHAGHTVCSNDHTSLPMC